MTDQLHKMHVSSTGNGRRNLARTDAEVEDLFQSNLAIWNDETEMLSNARQVIAHPAFLAIIGLGRQALPLILKDMASGGGPWFVALQALTTRDEYPVKQEHKTSAKLMTEDWLSWGKANGLIA